MREKNNMELQINKMKKSQMKIQQMAFMVMAVFIFFILAGLFYIVIQKQKWVQEANILEKNRAIELANTLASSAEFSCGAYCIDADRMMVLKGKANYMDFLGLKSIEIRKVYPENNKEALCAASNYPDCNFIRLFDKGEGEMSASSFVSLCSRINEKGYIYYKCEIAKLIIGYNIK